MPKFWRRGLQFLGEKLGGEITEDKDFEKLLLQVDNTEKGFSSFRSVMQNFNTYMEKFPKFFNDIANALKLIYSNTPYYPFIEEFLIKQQILEVHFEDMNKLLIKLCSRSSEWDKIFEEGKKQLVERENKRKEYDHYEKKLLKLKDSKDKKKIERNEEKYTKAASEYVEISEKIFNQLEGSLKLGWELANPVVTDFILGEVKLLDGINNTMSYFKDNIKRFSQIDLNINNPYINMKQTNYDPIKYIKGKELIRRVSASRKIPYNLSINLNDGKNQKIIGFDKGYDNILINTRLTNSFGKISENKLKEFIEFQDEFD